MAWTISCVTISVVCPSPVELTMMGEINVPVGWQKAGGTRPLPTTWLAASRYSSLLLKKHME